MTVRAIHSGGQTGADVAGLLAGLKLGIQTGGWAPAGWRTDAGPQPNLARLGLREHPVPGYPARTEANVRETDGTLLIGRQESPGSIATARLCGAWKKPICYVRFPRDLEPDERAHDLARVRAWLLQGVPGVFDPIEILNVAGNRERKNPGICQWTFDFLVELLGEKAG